MISNLRLSPLSWILALCLTLTACQRASSPGPVYDGVPEIPLALAYIGAPDSMSVEGRILVDGPLHDFARQLVGISMAGDPKALLNLLTDETFTFHRGSDGYLNHWAAQFTGKLYYGEQAAPKVFATVVEDLALFGPHQSMLQWFDFPQQPELAIFLYSFEPESGMMGRMLYPVQEKGQFRLILERPKSQ